MEQAEAARAPKEPSWLVGFVWLAVLCAGLFFYNVVRTDVGAETSYAVGQGMGGGLLAWVIFHFAVGKKRGGLFSGVALGFIFAATTAGTLINFKAKENREQMARMGASMKKEMDAMASAVKDAKPTARIDTTPAAQGEVGEMERFGRTFMSRMAELRNDYLRQLDAIGWDKILDMQRIAGDKSLSQSKATVGKARSLVASYREKALATIESARGDIDKLQVSEGAKAGFRKGFENSLQTSRGRLIEQLDLEAGIVDEVGKMFDLLSAKSGVWAVRGGKMVFSEQATLSSFNAHIAAIQKMSARQEALQAQAMESTRAKLDQMGK
jgi:hypothetical protein